MFSSIVNMNPVINKLELISKVNQLTIDIVTKFKSRLSDIKIIWNSLKMFRISVECNTFDENEDKQRQCYKGLKCFWPKCRFSTEIRGEFNLHVSQHLLKRQFVCDECNKQFNRYSNLHQHKRHVHSSVRPFVCRRSDCNKRFKTNGELKAHELTHCSVKPFQCDQCDRRFTRIALLNQHKILHNCDENISKSLCKRLIQNPKRNKNYKCSNNNCNKCFYTSTELKRHIVFKHSNERPFKCSVKKCKKSFKSNQHIKRHIKSVHQIRI